MSVWLTYLKLSLEQDHLIPKIYWNLPVPMLPPELLFGEISAGLGQNSSREWAKKS